MTKSQNVKKEQIFKTKRNQNGDLDIYAYGWRIGVLHEDVKMVQLFRFDEESKFFTGISNTASPTIVRDNANPKSSSIAYSVIKGSIS